MCNQEDKKDRFVKMLKHLRWIYVSPLISRLKSKTWAILCRAAKARKSVKKCVAISVPSTL